MPVAGAPLVVGELVASGLLRQVADRYEVTVKAFLAIREAELSELVEEEPVVAPTTVRVRGLTEAQVVWCERSLSEVGYSTEHDPRETIKWGKTWIEGTVEDLTSVAHALAEMDALVDENPDSYVLNGRPDEKIASALMDRMIAQAKKCCDTAEKRVWAVLKAR